MSKPVDSPEMLALKIDLKNKLTESMMKMSESEKNEWLRHLHNEYSTRFLKDNDRIWMIGQIFIPLSLAGLVYLQQATIYSIFPIALGSVLIISFWVIFAEHHRGFQNKSLAIVKAIEEFINLPLEGGKIDAHKITNRLNVQRLRWVMLYLVIAIWILATLLVFAKSLNWF